MADKKISALTGATTPLAGTEVLPVVQGGATVKVAVSDLTAGRAVTAASVNKVAITAPATASTLTIADGKTLAVNDNATLGTGGLTLGNSGGFTAAASKVLTANNSLTLAGTDATTQTFPTTSATIARTDAAQTFTGNQTFNSSVLGNGGLVTSANTAGAVMNITTAQNNGTTASPLYTDLNFKGYLDNIQGRIRAFDAAGNTTKSSLTLSASNASTGALIDVATFFGGGGVSIGNTTDPGATNLSVTGTTQTAALGLNGIVPSYTFDQQDANNQNVQIFRVTSTKYSVDILTLRAVAAFGASATNAAMYVGNNSATARSINAGGTVNVGGLDYAEYMTKCGDFNLAKGDICGIDINGKLTNVFADAISFVVKSTSPSYVGGDTWFTETKPTDEALVEAWEARMETARQAVDRISFAGQVPVNVANATAGQYIVPVVNSDGSIGGQAISEESLTLKQYMQAVGKVISIVNNVTTVIVKVS